MKGLLSVIVPVYNTEKYMNRCLESIINQTYRNLQIIIVDDGGTDSSFSICKEFEKKDPRVSIFSNNGKGVSSARNFGIKKATGKYITFLDSDDYLEMDAYEKALNNIGECDAIFFGYYEDYENLNGKVSISPTKTGITCSYDAIYDCMLPNRNCYFTAVWNKIFKREKIKNIYFEESYVMGEDEVWLCQAILQLSKIMLYNEPLYNYVQRNDSALHSNKKISENWISHVLAKEKVMQLLFEYKKNYNSIIAKEYNDLFYLTVHTYVIDGYSKSREVYNRIDRYKRQFFLSKNFSLKRKIKLIVISKFIEQRIPKKLLIKIWNFSMIKLKLMVQKERAKNLKALNK